jgi:DNA-binding NarL/FixJ family response regulator
MRPARILIADDHEIVRGGISALLEREPDWVVCGQAAGGQQAVDMAIALNPDVVLLDINMRDLSGIEAARVIRSSVQTNIVFMTAYDSSDLEYVARKMGASGFLSKSDHAHALVDAVRAVLSGKTFFPAEVRAATMDDNAYTETSFRPLTPREREVLALLAEGYTNKQVASRLGISAKTAETHRARIRSKLQLRSVSELVRYAIRNRIIVP